MSEYNWSSTFLELFDRCLKRYRSGDEGFTGYYSEDDSAFLRSIGCKPREFFDFVEDYGDDGDPTPSNALLIASVRRDYLLTVMDGEISSHEIRPSELPPKSAELDGIPWLPRIIEKARGKLRGELDPEIMYSCGGDRSFLRRHKIAPADFLRAVWAYEDDTKEIVNFVKNYSRQ